MQSIVNNEWVIAIVGGLLTSYAVIFINNLRVSRHARADVRQRIQLANNEVLNRIRRLVAHKELLSSETINCVLRSTAGRYSLSSYELHTSQSLADEMESEILDNPFLSSKQKAPYLRLVSKLREEGIDDRAAAAGRLETSTQGRRDISLIVVAATFSSVCLGILSLLIGGGPLTVSPGSLKKVFLFFAGAIFIPTALLWAVDFFRDLRELKTVRENLLSDLGSSSYRAMSDRNESTKADEEE
jgi:hypothetical protein